MRVDSQRRGSARRQGLLRASVWRTAVAVALLTVVTAGCAPRMQPQHQLIQTFAAADRLIRAGCFGCLREAADVLDRLAPPASRRAEWLALRTSVALLLAARARSLGLEGGWMAEADRLLADAAAPALLRTSRRIAAQVPSPFMQGTAADVDAAAADAREQAAAITPQDRLRLALAARTDPVAAHFHIALACAEKFGIRDEDIEGIDPRVRELPLVAFAIGACSAVPSRELDDVLAREPRFVEAQYHRGLQALGTGDLVAADADLAAAVQGFPDAPALWLARGDVHLRLEEYGDALTAFDRVLALVPDQRAAMLGRVRSLSHARRFTEAAAEADRMLTLGTWLVGDAYYWRAWNRRQLGQLEPAAADIELARGYLFNAEVPRLAGFIAYDRGRFDKALEELESARERRPEDCDVAFALGLVHARRQEPAFAGPAFAAAAVCAQAAQEPLRARLSDVERSALPGNRRAALRQRTEAALAAALRQQGLALLQAASSHAAAGHRAEARDLAAQAARWDAHRTEAGRLLDRLR